MYLQGALYRVQGYICFILIIQPSSIVVKGPPAGPISEAMLGATSCHSPFCREPTGLHNDTLVMDASFLGFSGWPPPDIVLSPLLFHWNSYGFKDSDGEQNFVTLNDMLCKDLFRQDNNLSLMQLKNGTHNPISYANMRSIVTSTGSYSGFGAGYARNVTAMGDISGSIRDCHTSHVPAMWDISKVNASAFGFTCHVMVAIWSYLFSVYAVARHKGSVSYASQIYFLDQVRHRTFGYAFWVWGVLSKRDISLSCSPGAQCMRCLSKSKHSGLVEMVFLVALEVALVRLSSTS